MVKDDVVKILLDKDYKLHHCIGDDEIWINKGYWYRLNFNSIKQLKPNVSVYPIEFYFANIDPNKLYELIGEIK